jgi:hypothetical protein
MAAAGLLAFAGCGGGGGSDTGDDVFDEIAEDAQLPDLFDPGPPDTGDEDIVATDEGDTFTGDVGEVPCERDQDCADVPIQLGPCERKVCLRNVNICGVGWQSDCCHPFQILNEDFEGDFTGWTLVDPNTADGVVWSVSDFRSAQGTRSLYFGNPECRTYYNGAVDEDCDPVDPDGFDATVVRGSATTPRFQLPPLSPAYANFAASVRVWIDAEPMVPGVAAQPDLLRIFAVVETSGTERADLLFTSVTIEKTTRGAFLYMVADLTDYAGSDVALRFSFDTLDGSNNDYEGAYIDDIRVFAFCDGTCETGNACADDGELCTEDSCQVFTNRESFGLCTYPNTLACIEPACTPQNVGTKCPVNDPCVEATCVEGQCSYTVVPDLECCRAEGLLSVGFEDGTTDFRLWAYQDHPTVKWQVSENRASKGSKSLYYGNQVSGNYVTDGAIGNFGEATSPPIELPIFGNVFLTFDLFLATEFDNRSWAEYYNPFGVDFFEVLVVEGDGTPQEASVRVWTSNMIHGTTGGAFLGVGVDLSDFIGKTVSIRFRFDTSDNEDNNHEGVFIDDIRLVWDSCVRKDCMGPHDCMVDDICRSGTCTDNQCDVEIIGQSNCCAVSDECDDNDPCTADGCLANVCVNQPAEGPGCCLARNIRLYNFDVRTDLDGYLVDNRSQPGAQGAETRWHLSTARYLSEPRSMRFGNELNYDNGGIAAGSATSPTFRVPSDGFYALSFQLFLDIESDAARDQFKVEVLEGANVVKVFDKANLTGEQYDMWVAVNNISLNTWKGKDIKLRFDFTTVNVQENSGLGIFVDDISVDKVCPR